MDAIRNLVEPAVELLIESYCPVTAEAKTSNTAR